LDELALVTLNTSAIKAMAIRPIPIHVAQEFQPEPAPALE
jgi:hypothetical protein